MIKKLRLPKKIKVGGTVYTIEVIDYDGDCADYAGMHEGLISRIRLTHSIDGIPKKEPIILEVLLHEIIHAVDFVYMGYILSEEVVEKLTSNLFQVLSDNDLKLFDKRYPNKINIGGFKYKVSINYKAESVSNDGAVRILHPLLKYNVGIIKNYSQDYLKTRFLEGILGVVTKNEGFFNDKEMETLKLPVMAAGLYQVFKESSLDRMIREWGK